MKAFALSQPRRVILRQLSDILIPSGGDPEPGAVEAGVPEMIEEWWKTFPRRERRRVETLISLFDLGPVVALRYRRRFHRLAPDKQQSWIASSQRSSRFLRRMPLGYLKQFVFLAYASSPEIEARLGYDYTCRLNGELHGRPTPRPA